MGDVSRWVHEVDAALKSRATPERAERERAYLKSAIDHYGVTVPQMRVAVRTALRGADIDRPALLAMVRELWAPPEPGALPVHERRAAAAELLERNVALLEFGDTALLEQLLRESGTWALVDSLAASVVGPLAEREPGFGPILDRWADDEDFWIRRSALLSQLIPLREGRGDFARFGRYADAMLHEKEFFIRKAIGWVLRDMSRKRPDEVYEWILPRAASASGVTLREAVRRLDERQRAAVLAAR
ncbi:DNA alkylation repair protein [Leucobacter luti]|uniref:DNA alkylation repair protein n=1 Tax=Leucobacter luti TaxID=340320 RepID=UPI001C6884A1|nr:DNA alkylation repair protein [Leucobacter luti]QYM76628.1 DNA alkylation repair protein [Leucobacter luti]